MSPDGNIWKLRVSDPMPPRIVKVSAGMAALTRKSSTLRAFRVNAALRDGLPLRALRDRIDAFDCWSYAGGEV